MKELEIDRLDKKIYPLVSALRGLGIETKKSCQGHLRNRLPYPWVDIDPRDSEKVLRATRWYNLQVLRKKTKNNILWVVLAMNKIRLMPALKDPRWQFISRELSLKELQESAIEFGEELQILKEVLGILL